MYLRFMIYSTLCRIIVKSHKLCTTYQYILLIQLDTTGCEANRTPTTPTYYAHEAEHVHT